MDQKTLLRNAKAFGDTLTQILAIEAVVRKELGQVTLDDPGAGSFMLQPGQLNSMREIGNNTAYRHNIHRLASSWSAKQETPNAPRLRIRYRLGLFPSYHADHALIALETIVDTGDADAMPRPVPFWMLSKRLDEAGGSQKRQRLLQVSERHLSAFTHALDGRAGLPNEAGVGGFTDFSGALACAEAIAKTFGNMERVEA